MSTYKEAGVDVTAGDICSSLAYQEAKSTFPLRQGMIGSAVTLEGGFTGALDFGDFYLVQNDDGVGTKVLIGEAINKLDTLGYDLLAMVSDDAVCVGAEVVSVSNTFDVEKVDEKKISPMIKSFAKACREHKIIIPGGEIAELGKMVGNGIIWNATAIGIVEKNKFITGQEVKAGDKIIGLKSDGFRSNGFSLVRHILEKVYGEKWYDKKFNDHQSWGEATLTPSRIYHSAVLEMVGRYKEPAKVDVKAIVHVTGGGIPGNIIRVLKDKKLGANLNNLFPPHDTMRTLQDIDTVRDDEAYKTWNMGIGMMIISNDTEKIIEIADRHHIKAQIIGEVTKDPHIRLVSQGYFEKGNTLEF